MINRLLCMLGIHDYESFVSVGVVDLYQPVIRMVHEEAVSIYPVEYNAEDSLQVNVVGPFMPTQDYVCLRCGKRTHNIENTKKTVIKLAWSEVHRRVTVRRRELKALEMVGQVKN